MTASPPRELAGWVTLRSLCRSRHVDPKTMLLHLKSLDQKSPGKFLRRGATRTGRRPPWLVHVQRLDAEAGPTRQVVDETIERFTMTVADLEEAVRSLARRVSAIERGRAGTGGGPPAAPGRSPVR